MVHGIAPAIPQMCGIVGFIPDMMLPEPPLPNPGILLVDLAPRPLRPKLIDMGGFATHRLPKFQPHELREPRLDCTPALRVIRVIERQRPDRVHVIRQHNPRVYPEGTPVPCHFHRLAQNVHVIDKQCSAPLRKANREKDIGPSDLWANIARHPATLRHDPQHKVTGAAPRTPPPPARRQSVPSGTRPPECSSPSLLPAARSSGPIAP